MYPSSFRYHRASSLAEASAALASLGPDAKVLAGGQTLIPLLKLRLLKPTDLIDIGRVSEAHFINEDASGVHFGALSTHAAIGTSDVSARHPILSDCSLGIADTQTRTLGTVGGSIAEADPSSCWPALLCALDAQVRCVSAAGERTQSVRELLREPYAPALRPGELIAAVHIGAAALDGTGAFVAFKRCAPAYPTASCALQIAFDGDRCRDVHLAFGCVALTPLVIDAAPILRGRIPDRDAIEAVASAASASAQPLADNKGSEAYKRSLVAGLVRRAFSVIEQRRRGETSLQTHFYYG